jgi:hypothetical protein
MRLRRTCSGIQGQGGREFRIEPIYRDDELDRVTTKCTNARPGTGLAAAPARPSLNTSGTQTTRRWFWTIDERAFTSLLSNSSRTCSHRRSGTAVSIRNALSP